jgi:hypothetical protein
MAFYAIQGLRILHAGRISMSSDQSLADIYDSLTNTEAPKPEAKPSSEQGVTIGITAQKGRVVINMGQPVTSIGLTPSQAREFAEALRQRANQIDAPRKRHKPAR